MPAGYRFDVSINGRTIPVEAPGRGAKHGERFAATIVSPDPTENMPETGDLADVNANDHVNLTLMDEPLPPSRGDGSDSHQIPTRRWSDDLCDCCLPTFCSPLCLLSFFVTPIPAAQVMTRLRLNACAMPGNNGPNYRAGELTFLIVLTIVALAGAVDSALQLTAVTNFGTSLLYVYVLAIIAITRYYIRRKYRAVPTNCGDYEDFCCAAWCSCCVVAQMARHTANNRKYRSNCCTKTGLPPEAPEMV